MIEQISTQYRPSSVSPPGETLADLLEEHGLSQSELAGRMGRPIKTINEVIKGKVSITRETAIQLERVLGAPADFWLTREARYQEWLARAEEFECMKEHVGWLKELPLADMVRFGWLARASSKPEQVRACLSFFGVASVGAWRDRYEIPCAAFRTSKKVASSAGAIAAWLRQGEVEAARIASKPYDAQRFRESLFGLRRLTRENALERVIPALRDAAAACGVAVCFVPTPAGCPASGATRWLSPTKAALQLSLRYKTNDHFWFTFFHEAGHILRHGKRMLFLESMDGLDAELESEADRFASDVLIPPATAPRLAELGWSKDAVTAFAEEIGIAPGIVVGRLQKEGHLPWSHLNALKVSYVWRETAAS